MPSYLEMVGARSKRHKTRAGWWLAANYEPPSKDEAGLAWQLRLRLKCMTERITFPTRRSQAERQSGNNAENGPIP